MVEVGLDEAMAGNPNVGVPSRHDYRGHPPLSALLTVPSPALGTDGSSMGIGSGRLPTNGYRTA